MKRTFVTFLIALLAAPALAGCLGGDDVTPEDDGTCSGDKCAIEGESSEGLGKIKGKIVDETLSIIEGANVTLRLGAGDSLTTRSSEGGLYAFNDVEPGTYTVTVTNVPVHKPGSQSVDVVADEVVEADFMLTLVPDPPQPYMFDFDLSGVIGCSAAFNVIVAKDYCGDSYAGYTPDESAQTVFDWMPDPRLTSLVLVLDSPGGVTQQELKLFFTLPNYATTTFQAMAGPAPLGPQLYEVDKEDWPSWEEGNQTMQVEVRASNEAATPQVAYQQKLQLFIGLFYNDMEVPDGYDPRGEA